MQLKKQSDETRTAVLSADIFAVVWKDFLDYIFFYVINMKIK
jgi:hypothetical protein